MARRAQGGEVYRWHRGAFPGDTPPLFSLSLCSVVFTNPRSNPPTSFSCPEATGGGLAIDDPDSFIPASPWTPTVFRDAATTCIPPLTPSTCPDTPTWPYVALGEHTTTAPFFLASDPSHARRDEDDDRGSSI